MKNSRRTKALQTKRRLKSCRRRLQVLQLSFTTSTGDQKPKLEDGRQDSASGKNSSTSSTSSSDCSRRDNLSTTSDDGGEGQPSTGSNIGSLVYAHVSMMGRRRAMEDRVTVAPPEWMAGEYYFFGVYDGHGGAKVAEKCEEMMHKCLAKHIEKAKKLPEEEALDWDKVMLDCFSNVDKEVDRDDERMNVNVEEDGVALPPSIHMGSTAVVALVGKEEMVVANCGDSRALLCRSGVPVPMSIDHKPDRADEKERIEAAGGEVINWNGWRVEGILATSRSLGDHYLKPYVTSVPEVTVTKRTDLDEFLIIATDGLFDVVCNEVACEVVKKCLDNERDCRLAGATRAATLLAELAMAKGSRDNISVIVVELSN